MSIAIDPEKVTAVLLADGWHSCDQFDLDAYEFVTNWENPPGYTKTRLDYSGGVGAAWREPSQPHLHYACPITSILAVRYKIKNFGK